MKYFLCLLWVTLGMHVLASEGQDSSRIVDQLKQIIDSNYVLTKNIAAIKRDLTRLTKQPEFAALNDVDAIARALTKVLQQHDKYLTVQHYVLISADTFSAAEEFAYNVKHLKRATIIGEPSKEGANP